ncbi:MULTISPECIES: NUDIX domain-containing protein [unclassified Sphingobacterium]|uniref:NUDIX hydrolase n=1 Tax=unclassified Sphingobacterium TaxID=2609468 RepID=UPI0010501651|nr:MULTISPECIES: NUDIX domain-containing protein [unclassified Sphingobacterium]MCS3554915.1 8-oxo-dGTP pyrophosphatase MutT (NUDIX family) [Sphingobacterium sp. JUb21]TCR05688.1 NUDIX domain-containing protein [Sphingobacterium sp. JUb20]
MATLNSSLLTAGLITLKDNKLLLAYSNNKKAWYLPGGKVDRGESSLTSLKREIREELMIDLNDDRLDFYCHITAPAYGENPVVIMEQDCFIYDLREEINPSNEIGAVQYFSRASYMKEQFQVIGVLMVFDKLEADKLIEI